MLRAASRIVCVILPAVMAACLAACVRGNLREIQNEAAHGRWLTVGELTRNRIDSNPNDPAARKALADLEQRVGQAVESADFDPVRYFYALAYVDFFKERRYLRAIDDMEQVLVYQLDNEEVLRFIDKAQAHVSADSQRLKEQVTALLDEVQRLHDAGRLAPGIEKAERAVALDPSNAAAKRWIAQLRQELEARQAARAASKRPPLSATEEPKADPAWLEYCYREALKAYVKGDAPKAVTQLQQLLAYQPDNERWQKSLKRIQQEMPR